MTDVIPGKAASSIDSFSASSAPFSDDEDNDGTTRLFVGNLVPALSDTLLRASLSKFGIVATIERNNERNFAHVSFSTAKSEDLKRCISALNQTRWMGTVVRVEVATEHFMARLKREWAANNYNNTNGNINNNDEDSHEAEEDDLPQSFSWKGKRTVFESDDDEPKRPRTDVLLSMEEDGANAWGEGKRPSRSSNIDAAAADLFGLEVDVDVPTTHNNNNNISKNTKPSNIDPAAADLFGLDWEAQPEPDTVLKPVEIAAASTVAKFSTRVKPSKEASKANLETVTAIGNDPSKIDLVWEHELQRNIIAQLFGGNNAIANKFSTGTNRCKSKALYLHFGNNNINAPQNNNVNNNKKNVNVNNKAPLGIPMRPFHTGNTNVTGRRKGLYKQISKQRIIPKCIFSDEKSTIAPAPRI